MPVPVPLVTLLVAVVGAGAVPQHTPRSVTGEPPSETTLPPALKAVVPLCVADVVYTTAGSGGRVGNCTTGVVVVS